MCFYLPNMKSLSLISNMLFAFLLSSCTPQKNKKAYNVFNEGVTLYLNSIDEQGKGEYEKATLLNKQSIDKFLETLKIDSTHPLARGFLAQSYYSDQQYKEAIQMFGEQNKLSGDRAVNYRGMGICKIHLGQIQEGKSDIDMAFSLDTTKEIRDITMEDLIGIGESAFQYVDSNYQHSGPLKDNGYKKFAIEVLILAYEYDTTRKDIALKISDFAKMSGDMETVSKYKVFIN